jgi:hypothetical protein
MQQIQQTAHRADDLIRAKVIAAKTSGMTQSKLLAILLIVLSIIVCFQSALYRLPIIYYLVFLVYLAALILCLVYF